MQSSIPPAASLDAETLRLYRLARFYGEPARFALACARRRDLSPAYERHDRAQLRGKTRSVRLSAGGLERIREIADAYGLTPRQYLEALMHFAVSQWERPGSWEAQGFDVGNYGPEGYADRWFA